MTAYGLSRFFDMGVSMIPKRTDANAGGPFYGAVRLSLAPYGIVVLSPVPLFSMRASDGPQMVRERMRRNSNATLLNIKTLYSFRQKRSVAVREAKDRARARVSMVFGVWSVEVRKPHTYTRVYARAYTRIHSLLRFSLRTTDRIGKILHN